jgi:predicted N-acyltransferase
MKPVELETNEYRIEVHADPAEVDAQAWDELLAQQGAPTPFMRHAYLHALHASGSAVPQAGWAPRFVTLHQDGRLQAACALYLKAHSYGEYVFDWAWADAYQRHGLAYYPKLLGAVPFTPVPGTRLLARDAGARRQLAAVVTALAQQMGLSSAHLLFIDEQDQAALLDAGWMRRQGLQFHWQQDTVAPVADLAALLARMQRDKRKKIQQERRRVAEQGVVLSVHEGEAITPALWDFFYRCYQSTYAAHHSTPYLTRDFFARMADAMPQHWLMFVARARESLDAPEGEPLAASLVAIDRAQGVAWGRYWGAVRDLPCLHFEACYYQPLAWCLANGFVRFEGGAQGEHKMARGLLPVTTHSAHWLRDQRFADAVGTFLERERDGLDAYKGELGERNPFKATPPAAS